MGMKRSSVSELFPPFLNKSRIPYLGYIGNSCNYGIDLSLMLIFIAALSVDAHYDAVLSLIPSDLAPSQIQRKNLPVPNFLENRSQQ